MSTKLGYFPAFYQQFPRADAKPVKQGHLTDATLQSGNEITVFAKPVPADKVYAWGDGRKSRDNGTPAFIYADINTATPTDIEGDLYAVITDSEQRDVLARKFVGDLTTLSDAAADPRTERPILPIHAPVARQDQHIELRVVADAASDGATVSSADSDVRLYYSEANV